MEVTRYKQQQDTGKKVKQGMNRRVKRRLISQLDILEEREKDRLI